LNSDDLNEGFEAFKVYNAIALHFTTDYNYFTYNGKTRVSEKAWLARKDRFFFKKVQRDIGLDNLVPFFVANYIDRGTLWPKHFIGLRARKSYELFNEEEHYNTFRGDLAYLKSLYRDTNSMISSPTEEHPALLKAYITKDISPITMIILQSLIKYSNDWNDSIGNDPQWSAIRSYLSKLRNFVIFDRTKCLEKYKNIFKTIDTKPYI